MSGPEKERSIHQDAVRRKMAADTFSTDLLAVYHEHFLNEGGDSNKVFERISKGSDALHLRNIEFLKRGLQDDIQANIRAAGGTAQLRVSMLAPHVGSIRNPHREAWQPENFNLYCVAMIIEGFGEKQGYYLHTEGGLERFNASVALFAGLLVEDGATREEPPSPDDMGIQVAMSHEAFLESRGRLRAFEHQQANTVRDHIVDLLSRLMGSEKADLGLVRANFQTLYCDPTSYRVSFQGHGSFELSIHLHRKTQTVIVAPPTELLTAAFQR